MRAWIDVRRSGEFSCTAKIAADVELRSGSTSLHTYAVGRSEWSDLLESPKTKDFEDLFESALEDLSSQLSAFVSQNVRVLSVGRTGP